LSASRVVSRVVETFQIDLPLSAVFDSPTVAELALTITANQSAQASDAEDCCVNSMDDRRINILPREPRVRPKA
jgi:phosphopantetheine binding protein